MSLTPNIKLNWNAKDLQSQIEIINLFQGFTASPRYSFVAIIVAIAEEGAAIRDTDVDYLIPGSFAEKYFS